MIWIWIYMYLEILLPSGAGEGIVTTASLKTQHLLVYCSLVRSLELFSTINRALVLTIALTQFDPIGTDGFEIFLFQQQSR